MTKSTADTRTVTTTHTVVVAAPPRLVYNLIAEVGRWPYLFRQIVHVERLIRGAAEERLRLWSVGNGAVRDWTSRRFLDRDNLRIRFRHESPAAPVASMSGEWVFVPLPGNQTSVVLLHEFRAVGDDAGATALIKQAVDRNATAELAAVKQAAELGDRLPQLIHTFADSVLVKADLAAVYDFLYRALDWPNRVPHVSRLVLDEAVANVQTIELDTDSVYAPARTMRLVRLCSPYHSIIYKQTHPPAVLSEHVGGWYLHPTADGVRVTAQNTVVVHPGWNGRVTTETGTVDVTEALVRRALRENCLAILLAAKEAAEQAAGTAAPEMAEAISAELPM